MRKLKGLLTIMMLTTLLVGCGAKSESITTFQQAGEVGSEYEQVVNIDSNESLSDAVTEWTAWGIYSESTIVWYVSQEVDCTDEEVREEIENQGIDFNAVALNFGTSSQYGNFYSEYEYRNFLLEAGFTEENIDYAVSQISDTDWEYIALSRANLILADNLGHSDSSIKADLESAHFSDEQIAFAYDGYKDTDWGEQAKLYILSYTSMVQDAGLDSIEDYLILVGFNMADIEYACTELGITD